MTPRCLCVAARFICRTSMKSEFKKSRARFFNSQILLAVETKRMPLARPIFNLKELKYNSCNVGGPSKGVA